MAAAESGGCMWVAGALPCMKVEGRHHCGLLEHCPVYMPHIPAPPPCPARRLSSYGEEQLRWLDGQLSEGRHTLVMVRATPAALCGHVYNTAGLWSIFLAAQQPPPSAFKLL